MFKNFAKRLSFIMGDPNKKEIEKHTRAVEDINALAPDYEALSDEALRAKTDEFRALITEAVRDETDPAERFALEQALLDELLPEAFAAVREAGKRAIGLRHFDVQFIGGIVMHQNKIAEMRTGEGKTLVATLPTYLNALAGHGVHIVTVNDYLARRDARWMAPIFAALGLSVGVLQEAARTENGRKAFVVDFTRESPHEDQHHLRLVDRQEAYAADVTYGTNHEFGFDYLRDNMTYTLDARVQRERYYAVVDEVDNILIDEARTPLIISGPAEDDPSLYHQLAKVARQLKLEHYEIDERNRGISLNELGEAQVEKLLGQPLRDPDRPEEITPEQGRIMGHLEQALRAEFLFKKNKDYLVEGGKVVIVDEFTGRKMVGRRWSDGLHQAVEAKEGVPVQAESVTYATVTLQNYFRLYNKLAGMSGTALTSDEEFSKIYKLSVVTIPTNLEYQATRPNSVWVEAELKENGLKFKYFARKEDPEKKPVLWRRKDYPDVVYRTEEAKLRAIAVEILQRHLSGQPLLIGTTSVELSERVAERLRPDALQRLAQAMLIRRAWYDKNPQAEEGMRVPELEWLNAPLDSLARQDLGKALREAELSTNAAGEDNVGRLAREINADPAALPELARILQAGLKPAVLNAKKHDEESQIIAGAGALGAITIATNMAGRGVDIKLGGELAEEIITAVNRVLRKAGHTDPYDYTAEQRRAELQKMPESEWGIYASECQHYLQTMTDFETVKLAGGLHVIGTERHEARRIDNQLRGRAARQGDPGSSQFYLSLEDDLMRRFSGQQVGDLMQRFKIDDSLPISHSMVNQVVEGSQERVEGANLDTRKHLLEYDDVLNAHRNRIYAQRDRVFIKDDLTDDFMEMLTAEVSRRVGLAEGDEEGYWKLLAWLEEAQPTFPVGESVYPSFMLKLLMADVAGATDVRAKLLNIAHNALEAEREHLLMAVETQIERTAERLDAQIKEKKSVAELALEELDNMAQETGAPVSARPAYKAVSEALGLTLQPDMEAVRDFDYRAFKKQIPAWAETAVSARVRAGLILAIERRLGAGLGLGNIIKTDMDWDAVAEQLNAAAVKTHQSKTERSLAEIERELKALPAPLDEAALCRALISMAYGTTTGFDQQHRKVVRRTLRLTYVYLAAESLADEDAAELKDKVLAHLRGALTAQQGVFGEAQFALIENRRLSEMPPPVRAAILAAAPDEVETTPLNQLSTGAQTAARSAVGQRALSDILRQIMLQVISQLWVEHLTTVEALRTAIGLEAYAQRDPLVAYKARASETFQQLLINMRAGVVSRAFNVRPVAPRAAPTEAPARAPQKKEGAVAPISAPPMPEPPPAEKGGGRKRPRSKR